MNTTQLQSFTRPLAAAMLTAVLGLLGACSDSQPEPAATSSDTSAAAPAKQSTPSFDHGHGDEVSDLVKHKFEHDFAEQCVERELKGSSNPDEDRQRLEKPCLCIGEYLMKDLTAKEAELFLEEHKNTQSLMIRYQAAAYNCLQKNAENQGNQLPVVVPQQPQ